MAVRPWLDVLIAEHGAISQILSLEPPREPDVQLVFESETVGFEVTNLTDSKLEHFASVTRELRRDNVTASPSLSGKSFESREEMAAFALNFDSQQAWTPVADEMKAWGARSLTAYQRKCEHAKERGVRYVVMFAKACQVGTFESQAVVHVLQAAVAANPENVAIILLILANPLQYEGWLLRKGKPAKQRKSY
jgi:hypothetical protein